MFENARAMAVLAASDIRRARAFYEETLGLSPERVFPDAQSVIYRLADVPVLVYRTGYAGTAKNTVLAIDTDDLARDMTALRGRGVTFMEYDVPGFQTVDGVAELPGERAAWFEDSEGNILALSQST